jgi:hypothetical protein
MAGLPRYGSSLLAVLLVVAAAGGGCGSSSDSPSQFDAGGGGDDATGADDTGSIFGHFDGSSGRDGGHQAFDVEPSALQTLTVPLGQSMAAMPYSATLNGNPVSVAWTIDRGELGTIGAGPSSTATFMANGSAGGLVNVIAGYQGLAVKRQLLVKIDGGTQTAPNSSMAEQNQVAGTLAQLTTGGGVGGVGGEGLGQPVTDMATLTALQSPGGNGSSENLQILYPYDRTVFPRALLAPLIQWSWTPGDADAVQIQLTTTSGSFSWTGVFGRPAILSTTKTPFTRMPIPQDIWTAATNTAGGLTPSGKPDQLTVSIVVTLGGMGYGPVTETWTIAPARLEGTVYYNSYGTRLVYNSNFTDRAGNQDGAAVLAIKEGALSPVVVAGTKSSTSGSGCRVCHTLSAGGSTLVVQHGDDYQESSSYALQSSATETVLGNSAYISAFGWTGLSNDGTLALTNAADLAQANGCNGGWCGASALWAFPPPASGGTPLPSAGIPSDLLAGTPAFSPDTRHVAFDFGGGTIEGVKGNGTQLVALDFDATTNTFQNLKILATMPKGERAGFPSFFPTNDAVAFHYQIVNSNHRYNTWDGAQAQVWWSDLATGTASNLYALNGLESDGVTSYLPASPYTCPPGSNCGYSPPRNDTTLNYEPTVNPISSGGYIWVVFTSRRAYGNVATTNPWLSDPRDYDNTQLANATTKKLWVAAIDLGAKPGTDPSHPAFYLPAQELLAGNSRGFWVLNPCLADGSSCQSGDECCDGYCEPSANGGLVCSNVPPNDTCSMLQEKCASASQCCDSTNLCINGFCAQGVAN